MPPIASCAGSTRASANRRRCRPAAFAGLAASCTLSACVALGEVAPEAAGLGAGAGAGVLTANPIVGVAVGLGVRLATAEGIGYVNNEQRRQVQGAIAAAAGDAEDSNVVRWSTHPDALYRTLFGKVGGHVQVVRDFGGRIRCREILYTVEDQGGVEELVDDPGAEVRSVDDVVTNAADGDAPAKKPEQLAGDRPILAAVICKGSRGWQWAVSEPSAENP